MLITDNSTQASTQVPKHQQDQKNRATSTQNVYLFACKIEQAISIDAPCNATIIRDKNMVINASETTKIQNAGHRWRQASKSLAPQEKKIFPLPPSYSLE